MGCQVYLFWRHSSFYAFWIGIDSHPKLHCPSYIRLNLIPNDFLFEFLFERLSMDCFKRLENQGLSNLHCYHCANSTGQLLSQFYHSWLWAWCPSVWIGWYQQLCLLWVDWLLECLHFSAIFLHQLDFLTSHEEWNLIFNLYFLQACYLHFSI